MKIYSSSVKDNGILPQKYTCEGEGISPPLNFADISIGAKSLVLMVEKFGDEEKFTNWLVWGINPGERMFLENSTPENSLVGINSAGTMRYLPPCPDVGEIFRFQLMAISNTIALREGATRYELEQEIQDYIIDTAGLSVLCKKEE